MSIVKEIAHAFRTREGIEGFVTATILVITILTTVNFFGAVEFRTSATDYWVSPNTQTFVFGIPSVQNPEYRLYVFSIGVHGGSINIRAERVNGWFYNGTVFVGDTILLGEYRLLFKELNMDREKPICLQYYSLVDIKTPLVISLCVLVFVATCLFWPRKKDLGVTLENDVTQTTRLDPRFNHVEAWLFYESKIDYDKGERDPKKNNPRFKLVCNTSTKKAFYVDNIVWKMILEDKIRWHSEDYQNTQQWCDSTGYKLIKRDAREADLLQIKS